MNFTKEIKFGDQIISSNSPIYIIAEAGVNHNGNLEYAKQLIDIAVEAGANAVKFQNFKTKNIILRDVEKAPYQLHTTSESESQYKMLKNLEISFEFNKELVSYCERKQILFMSTPYDIESLNELEKLNVKAYKIASTDLTNIPFIMEVGKKGKPIILSCGMSYLPEIEIALSSLFPLNKNIILLQCTSNYPTSDDEVNLNVINTLKEKFNLIIGFSDHTPGVGASPYAVPMGVKVIEKHFTLDKELPGPDHKASLSPEELKEFVKSIRKVEKYMGSSFKIPTISEVKTRNSLQKNLVASRIIKKGEKFTYENLIAKRTGGVGISPIYINQIINKPSNKDYNIDDIINE